MKSGCFMQQAACLALTTAWAFGGGLLPAAAAQEAEEFKTPPSDMKLPEGIKAEWDLGKAFREKTPTRERICINGLWKWYPGKGKEQSPPAIGWGYFKVPGPWPSAGTWTAKDSQTPFLPACWNGIVFKDVNAAWYSREISIPDEWKGRRIALDINYLNSGAIAYLDGTKAGELHFPGGEIELSGALTPGKHTLAIYVVAMALKDVVSYAAPEQVTVSTNVSIAFKGLCGDIFLSSEPRETRVSAVKVETSVRGKSLLVNAELTGLKPEGTYVLSGRVLEKGAQMLSVKSKPFSEKDLSDKRISFSTAWENPKLWDVDTPGNQYTLELSLLGAGGETLDVFQPVGFGFREFRIAGRDLLLNETPIHLFHIPFDATNMSAAAAAYEKIKEGMQRMKAAGINAVYTHNYSCIPGSHISQEELMKAGDDIGMLVILSLPHMKDYDWKAQGAERNNGYRRHAEWYVRQAQNHPSVVLYVMNHNNTGYRGADQDPDLIDGIYDPAPHFKDPEKMERRNRALLCERIAQDFDKTRPIYHHYCGNLGQMYTLNCYLDFVPPQERAEWFTHWSEKGVKPLLLVEYGEPLSSNWFIHRGESSNPYFFGGADVYHQIFLPQWGAQFRGDVAYDLCELEKSDVKFEAKFWKALKGLHQSDYPSRHWPDNKGKYLQNIEDVQAEYIAQTWPFMRALGVSGLNLWGIESAWKRNDNNVLNNDIPFATDWENIQRPGFSPDFQRTKGLMTPWTDLNESDWRVDSRGQAIIRWSKRIVAFIAGKKEHFTAKDHNYVPGETVEKQIVVLNDSRRPLKCGYSYNFGGQAGGKGETAAEPGKHVRIPISFKIPEAFGKGEIKLEVAADFENGEKQTDSFSIHVLSPAGTLEQPGKTSVYDPKGETVKLLKKLGVNAAAVEANADLKGVDVLVIGKNALTVDGPAPDISKARDGLKVIIFEQSAETLEKRLGFRVAEYGLRNLFPRVPGHPLLSGIAEVNLRDWRGEATLLAPWVEPNNDITDYLSVEWCGYKETRVWRPGCYGNVASVLIEKPTCGDFLPIVDGGFDLQYSPLLAHAVGKGVIVFCQLDVTGRTEDDPASLRLAGNLFNYVRGFKPAPKTPALYAGDEIGLDHLKAAGFKVSPYAAGSPLRPDTALIVGPGGAKDIATADISTWLKNGGRLICAGLSAEEVKSIPSCGEAVLEKGEHISSYFKPLDDALFAGIGCSEVNLREPRDLPLFKSGHGFSVAGDGVLARTAGATAVFAQIAPWQFDCAKFYNLKPTFKRSSFLLARLLSNAGVESTVPVVERIATPPTPLGKDDVAQRIMKSLLVKDDGGNVLRPDINAQKNVVLSHYRLNKAGVDQYGDKMRWLKGLYTDIPEHDDDPYRYFRW